LEGRQGHAVDAAHKTNHHGGYMENELTLRTGPYRTTFVGTEITRQSTKEEWRNYLEILKRVDWAKQWAIGDALRDGKQHYGDGLYKEAAKIVEMEPSSLRVYKSIAERFELLTRFNNLTWKHHYEVASLKRITETKDGKLKLSNKPDMDKMQEFLQMAEKEGWSVRELADMVKTYKRRQQEEIRLANEPEKYAVILADPAWEYDFSKSDSREIDNNYLPSNLNDMKRLKIPAADDCVLFIWATSPKLREALELIKAWGFEYKTCMIWVKDKIGMGYYARQKHELLLISSKGRLQLPDESIRPESVFYSDRTEHSEKPGVAFELIEQMYPEYNKLEMFQRKERPGWDGWGDETI
jgi:N6-adenosine-specific RNA methylase IME4